MSLAYTRKFIILKKEFSTMAGRNPKGHCKLEIRGLKGIVTVNIENAEVDNFYNVLFISDDKANPVWELGKIFTDDLGRGKGEYSFIQRELENKNFPIDRVSGILITRENQVCLGGYLTKEDGSIERYIKSMPLNLEMESKSEPEADPIPEILELDEVEVTEIPEIEKLEEVQEFVEAEEILEEILEIDEVEQQVDIEPMLQEQETEVKKYEEEMPEEIIELNNEEIIEEKENNEFELEVLDEDSMEPDYKTLDYIKKLNQKNQTTNYVLSILRFFPYIEPFTHNIKGYNWWLVELDKENEYRAFLPYFSYIVGGNNKEYYNSDMTTCNQLMSKYGHYLFGLYNEGEAVKYFVYGIPGSFTISEHPYRGTNGFNTWYQGKNIEGYWILYIDPMTGRPVKPVIPMIPVN
ncbi:hypothetical protein EV204_101192 [Tissierella praeacuta]|uniref:hypothetical protein n=1 Tax=Tissierella praeacuta TaxID=43131 RepID=UPI001046B543|nr:hypothetical protein [Tissierella praeacuta]TCU79215.1 hypothetical protein EV204_101192 [Tissierella praeacuta]